MGGIKARMLFNSNKGLHLYQVDERLCHAIVRAIKNSTTGDQGHVTRKIVIN